MSAPDRMEAAEAAPDTPPDAHALVAALRTAGAGRFDPVRWHYIEALARRAAAHDGSTRRVLDARLTTLATGFQQQFEQAQQAAREAALRSAEQHPHAAGDLQKLLDAGDFKALQRHVSTLEAGGRDGSLAALVRQLEQASPELAEPRPALAPGSRTELKAIRQFRSTWSKLSVEKQLAQALEQAPRNAGPINSHMLVLRSLAFMRDVSPDYLNRFISYVDTLLCLELGEKDKEKPGGAKKPQGGRAAKK